MFVTETEQHAQNYAAIMNLQDARGMYRVSLASDEEVKESQNWYPIGNGLNTERDALTSRK